jgi:hypothetical protein
MASRSVIHSAKHSKSANVIRRLRLYRAESEKVPAQKADIYGHKDF